MSKILERWIHTACVWEATAPKPGNVHPGASFCDLSYEDFLSAADAAAPRLAKAGEIGVAEAVFQAIEATRSVVSTNVNLGICLLIAPLAAVPIDVPLDQGVEDVLRKLTREDAERVYEAIRLSQAGGLDSGMEGDVAARPTGTLREMMALAADRDSIADEYAHCFGWTLGRGRELLEGFAHLDREQMIVRLFLSLLGERPDSLIARKCGREIAWEASNRAAAAIRSDSIAAVADFDRWLRRDGNRRNPGTTADFVAAILFCGLRDGVIADH